jgi:hypothetical protein
MKILIIQSIIKFLPGSDSKEGKSKMWYIYIYNFISGTTKIWSFYFITLALFVPASQLVFSVEKLRRQKQEQMVNFSTVF